MQTTTKLRSAIDNACRGDKLASLNGEFVSLWGNTRSSIDRCRALLRNFCRILDEHGRYSESETVFAEGERVLANAERVRMERERNVLRFVGGVVVAFVATSLLRRAA